MNKSTENIPTGKTGTGGGGGGPYIAKIVSYLDPTYMGMLEVEILRPTGNSGIGAEGQLHQVKMITPFYGVTGSEFLGKDPDDYNNTQKSYGMWFIPPDVGSLVIVFFIDGDAKRGYWFGCVPDEAMNIMYPGIAATELVIEGKGKERLPVANYNKLINKEVKDASKDVKKPRHLITDAFIRQGLLRDDIRGITTSSARREVPSMVFGVSTPGPVDKRSGAKKGKIGKKEHLVDDIFVSRLGGSTFVLDDGDDQYLRSTSADAGPPDYVAVGRGDKGGDVTIPHNELIRLRTRTGHQILLHNSEDLIYIGNARGTAWIELTSNGKIDIFSSDSISIHTANDINLRAERDINFEAIRNINFKAGNEFHLETTKAVNIVAGDGGKITVSKGNFQVKTVSDSINFESGKNTTFKSASNHLETASTIHMNGPAAPGVTASKLLEKHLLPTEKKDKKDKVITVQSILRRMPTHEPYPQHENLEPTKYTPEKTNRDIGGRYDTDNKPNETMKDPAPWWTKANDGRSPVYTTSTDPFMKVKGRDK